MYVQAAEEVLVDRGQIFLPFLDDYFIPFSVILHRSSCSCQISSKDFNLTHRNNKILLAGTARA